MCETPIKRFARMVTKHFVFKYGLQVVLPNSINTTKVGGEGIWKSADFKDANTNTLTNAAFRPAFVLISSCWHALIETKRGHEQSGRDCVCPAGKKACGLSANNLLVTYVAFAEGSGIACFVSWWS